MGINRYVWRDLLKRVVDPLLAAADDPLPAALFDDPEALAAALRDRLATFADAVRDADAAGVVATHERAFATGRQPLLGGALLDVLNAPGIDDDTLLRRAEVRISDDRTGLPSIVPGPVFGRDRQGINTKAFMWHVFSGCCWNSALTRSCDG